MDKLQRMEKEITLPLQEDKYIICVEEEIKSFVTFLV